MIPYYQIPVTNIRSDEEEELPSMDTTMTSSDNSTDHPKTKPGHATQQIRGDIMESEPRPVELIINKHGQDAPPVELINHENGLESLTEPVPKNESDTDLEPVEVAMHCNAELTSETKPEKVTMEEKGLESEHEFKEDITHKMEYENEMLPVDNNGDEPAVMPSESVKLKDELGYEPRPAPHPVQLITLNQALGSNPGSIRPLIAVTDGPESLGLPTESDMNISSQLESGSETNTVLGNSKQSMSEETQQYSGSVKCSLQRRAKKHSMLRVVLKKLRPKKTLAHPDVKCDICGRMEKGFRSLARHLMEHQIHIETTAKILLKMASIPKVQHEKMAKRMMDSGWKVCDICGKNCYENIQLAWHMEIHNSDKETTKSVEVSEAHTQTTESEANIDDDKSVDVSKGKTKETNDKVGCFLCNESFTDAASVMQHMHLHTQLRLHCPACKQVYPNNSELIRHFMQNQECRMAGPIKKPTSTGSNPQKTNLTKTNSVQNTMGNRRNEFVPSSSQLLNNIVLAHLNPNPMPVQQPHTTYNAVYDSAVNRSIRLRTSGSEFDNNVLQPGKNPSDRLPVTQTHTGGNKVPESMTNKCSYCKEMFDTYEKLIKHLVEIPPCRKRNAAVNADSGVRFAKESNVRFTSFSLHSIGSNKPLNIPSGIYS